MNTFVEMHGKVDKPIAAIASENTLRIEEVEQEQQTLVKEACPSVLTPKKEMFPHVFHDPMACYMENIYNQNLQLMVGCKLRNEGDDKSMSVLDIDCFIPEVSFQLQLFF
jgi:hypothetical protein